MCGSPVSHSNERWPRSVFCRRDAGGRMKRKRSLLIVAATLFFLAPPRPRTSRRFGDECAPQFDLDTQPSGISAQRSSIIHRPQRATGRGVGSGRGSGQGDAPHPAPPEVEPPLPAKVKRPLALAAGTGAAGRLSDTSSAPHLSARLMEAAALGCPSLLLPLTDRCQPSTAVKPGGGRPAAASGQA